jgi:hypothetical protein
MAIVKSLDKMGIADVIKYEIKLHKIINDFDIQLIVKLGGISRLIIRRAYFDMKIVLVTEDFRLFEFTGTSDLFQFWYEQGMSKCHGDCVDRKYRTVYDSLETFINKIDSKDYERITKPDEYD